MTKIMIGLVNSLASNRQQAIDEDQGCFMDHHVCYVAFFSWVDNMLEFVTYSDWTWEFQFAWHHAISTVSMTMAKGTNGSSDKILLCFLHSGRWPTDSKRPSAGCPECICNRPRPWSRPCVSDWSCGAVILLNRGEFGREKNKICYQRGCFWTFCYMPNL